jgi:ABC-type dipeptide/oligopeptide/nickel transport system permease subunit
VEAARALGAGDLRVIVLHILPNIIQPVIVQAAIGMAGAILAEATMSFPRLGVPPLTASWGAMLNDSRAYLFSAPHLVLVPGGHGDAGSPVLQLHRRRRSATCSTHAQESKPGCKN